MDNYTPEAKFWFSILDAALKIPGAKIDREVFLQKTYEKYSNQETIDKILQVGTQEAGIELTLMDRMANDSIKQHTKIATTTSFVAGIPGGLVMAATIPADVIQFYYHVIVQAQKLAYIYGLKPIDNTDDSFKEILTVFIGTMIGIGDAENTLKEVLDEQFNKKLAKITIGKVLDKTTARIAAVIGVQLTKKSIGRVVAKAIPFIGGIVSGGMTYFSYRPMCNNLRRKLYDVVGSKQQKKE
jgi:hypothetical protein